MFVVVFFARGLFSGRCFSSFGCIFFRIFIVVCHKFLDLFKLVYVIKLKYMEVNENLASEWKKWENYTAKLEKELVKVRLKIMELKEAERRNEQINGIIGGAMAFLGGTPLALAFMAEEGKKTF